MTHSEAEAMLSDLEDAHTEVLGTAIEAATSLHANA